MDTHKIQWDGVEGPTLEFYEATTQNAIQDLNQAIKSQKQMQKRLENADTK
jgi:hypothetical protein